MNAPSPQPPNLRARALRLLATREHARAELLRKLAPHAADRAELEAVLDRLQAEGWLNEERVLESVLHQKAARFGAARVRQELARRGLDAGRVREALDGLRDSEPARARAVWDRKFGARSDDPAERARQIRFLVTRGFAVDVARRVVQGHRDED